MTVPDLAFDDTIDEAWCDAVTEQLNDLPLAVESGIVTGASTDASGNIAVTFAEAFAAEPAVFLTRRTGGGTVLFTAMYAGGSTTGFTVTMFSGTTRQASAGGMGFNWLAIGARP